MIAKHAEGACVMPSAFGTVHDLFEALTVETAADVLE